jgi:hypothetical protein
MMCVKPNALAKDLELVMKCKMNCYPKQFMMRFPEGYSFEMMCVKPNALAKDLELVRECTMNGYPKQCMMRFQEVYAGEMVGVKPDKPKILNL